MNLTTCLLATSMAATAAAQAPPGYYSQVDATDASTLRVTLHGAIDDHTRYPYTSSATDTWDILEMADQDPNSSSAILDIYRNESYAKVGGGNTSYNREHSWPKSYGFPNDGGTNYAYTDCHHLFLSDGGYNSSRSNKPYRDCGAGCSEKVTVLTNGVGGGSGVYPGNSDWTSGSGTTGTWETWGSRRGDVARALMYLDVRYEGGTHSGTGVSEPQLILTDNTALIATSNTGANESLAYMGELSTLLAWHYADPVDDRERTRNDIIGAFQGNRNPFIDHPEWVDCLFAGTCSGGGGGGGTGPGPGSGWINEIHYDNASSDVGEGVEVAGPAGTDLSGWTIALYNGNGGSVYGTANLSGTIADQSDGFGVLWFPISGLQNGAPDGLALVDGSGAVVQFLSYEGTLLASGGPAAGTSSTDVGVSETSSTPSGYSLQLSGTGSGAADFAWGTASASTPGQPNGGQSFSGGGGGDITPPDAPTGLGATAGNAQVDLDWSDSSESDLAGYTVYRRVQGSGSFAAITSTLLSGSSFTDAGATNGTTYEYVVTASDATGNESLSSAVETATPTAPQVEAAWINELHYDDKGSDRNEGVEVAGTAGLSLSGWSLVAYNGSGGGSYQTISLSGTISNQAAGLGTRWFAIAGLQNGGPDGVALVDAAGNVVQFLSYEGTFTASNGPAAGLGSISVGVQETSSTRNGHSLQLGGSGSSYADFTWQSPQSHTRGSINAGQSFN